MEVEVKFFTTLRDITKVSRLTLDISGSNIGDVINALVAKFGDKFRQEILMPDGSIYAKILVNGNFIDRIDPLRHPVNNGDTVCFFPPAVGG